MVGFYLTQPLDITLELVPHVEEVETVLNVALNHGAELLGEVTEKKIENVGILKFVYFRDPEGNIIEIQSWEKKYEI